jgi:hypothetical protein
VAKVWGVPKLAEPTDLYRDGDPEESSLNYAASVALPCLRFRARFAARKNIVGRWRREREVYGFTCTLASPVTNWIGRCCESLAFTCTIDRVLAPGASALITMPTMVPVPLAPNVFG